MAAFPPWERPSHPEINPSDAFISSIVEPANRGGKEK